LLRGIDGCFRLSDFRSHHRQPGSPIVSDSCL